MDLLRGVGMLTVAFALLVCPPIVFAAPKNIETVQVTEGNNFDLQCDISSVEGYEVSAVVWFVNDTLIDRINVPKDGKSQDIQSSQQRRYVYLDLPADLAVLRLKDLRIEDSGEYKCRVRVKTGGRKDSFIRLEVIDAPNVVVNTTGDEQNSTNTNDDDVTESVIPQTELADFGNSTLPDYIISESLTSSSTDASRFETYKTEESDERTGSHMCGPPPMIPGAGTQLRGDEHAVGTIATYQCGYGYVTQGSGKFQVVCEEEDEAKWTNPKITCVPRSCGDPGYVSFSRRIGNLFTFPNKVEFQCDEGYKLRGHGTRYCQASGEWSGRLPSCEQIYCTVPSDPENGRVLYSSLEYGTLLQYECDKGFVLKNHQPRYCSENETWSNDEPVCIEATCDIPKAPEHGFMHLSGDLKAGSLALYSCEAGRRLVGASTSKCLETGQWTFPTPKCSSACIIPDIANGDLGRYETGGYHRNKLYFVRYSVGDTIKDGEKVMLHCNEGYFPEGSKESLDKEIVCEDGHWDKPTKCRTASCEGEPPPTENGYPVVTKRHHGYVIYYKCKPLYKKTPGHVECKYGEWEGQTPVCTDTRCYLRDLHVEGLKKPSSQFVVTDGTITVICMDGYKASGSSPMKISCKDAEWIIPPSPCIKERPYLEESSSSSSYTTRSSRPISALGTTKEPLNATRNPNGVVEEECFCTYMIASTILAARTGGKQLHYGSRIKRGDTVKVSCSLSTMALTWRNGLRISGSANLTCDVCENWMPDINFPKCYNTRQEDVFIALGGKMKLLPTGKVQIREKERLDFTCESKSAYPVLDTTKSGYAYPTYESKRHSDVMYKTRLAIYENDVVDGKKYECYYIDYYGRTSAVLELKLAEAEVLCPNIDTRDLHAIYSNERRVNSYARLLCRDSTKTVVGSTERTCLKNGKWSGADDQICVDVTCPGFVLSDGLQVSFSNRNKVGSIAVFSCKAPGELVGMQTSLCLGNGTWNNFPPACKSPECSLETLAMSAPDNVVPDMSEVTSETLPDNSEVQLLCEQDLVLTGNRKATCSSGKWEFGNAKCEKICRLDSEIPPHLNIHPIKESYRLGESILLSCSPDYKLTSEVERIMCIGSSWSDPISGCEAVEGAT